MSLAEGALAAINMGQANWSNAARIDAQNAQLKIQRESQDIENQKFDDEQTKKKGRENFSNIILATGKAYDPDHKTQNWVELQKTDPDLLVQLSNDRPEYQTFTDENGNVAQAKLHAYIPAPNAEDGYIVQLQRLDTGAIVPLTEKRSANGNDNPRIISKEEFTRNLDRRFQAGIGKDFLEGNAGALMTAQSNLADHTAAVQESALSEAILDKAATTALRNDPAAMSEFYARVTATDDLEALKTMFTGIGGDADTLLAEVTAKAEADGQRGVEVTIQKQAKKGLLKPC